jgi:hypothetical protein
MKHVHTEKDQLRKDRPEHFRIEGAGCKNCRKEKQNNSQKDQHLKQGRAVEICYGAQSG